MRRRSGCGSGIDLRRDRWHDRRGSAFRDRRADTVQVTYDGHPLYVYAHEGKGEVKCHDVFLNGGNWYVVRPGGDPAPPG